ncbi:hypothetical protein FXW07_00200 [Methanosarcina sp. DH1]|uniref:hypothetical protein n=1 Tax=Methanosarcina sp. DH1 TaxID=2605695 RepID=UPI001E3CFCCB|nr:hypothetical protein [Methanosarcina sp. DH1]MCC4765107.1 hypothetical protein [Methanosarcina sp. DH1]
MSNATLLAHAVPGEEFHRTIFAQAFLKMLVITPTGFEDKVLQLKCSSGFRSSFLKGLFEKAYEQAVFQKVC